jgi:5-deoxy-glucuronate isomerase
MSSLLLKPAATSGLVHHVTPESAGWTYVGFDLLSLAPGEGTEALTPDRETCLVLITGTAKVIAGDLATGPIGGRASPFEGKPWSVYVPAGTPWSLVAESPCVVGVCTAPGEDGSRAPRLIGPDDVGQETRGKGSNIRHVTNILPESEPADSLLVVEVITPGGNTSSYPPHKHDEDNLPAESLLEETYYHRLSKPQGFAFQRVYTDDRSLDETMLLQDGDVVLVPKGYHPCATIHGYDLYYLNVMAGPKRTWRFHNAPEHAWLLSA